MQTPIEIDGRTGEGGGQILRSSLSLSVATGVPVHLQHIRGGRKKPGLMRQHLTCVRAAQAISGATVSGDELRSQELLFEPAGLYPGSYRFAVGSAGSCLLVLQTVLPPLLLADAPSDFILEGGTHNPMAPPFDMLREGFLPPLARMGSDVTLDLLRPGFFPAGGGEVRAHIEPATSPRRLELLERGPDSFRAGDVHIAHLSSELAERQVRDVGARIPIVKGRIRTIEHPDSHGPGNAIAIRLGFANVTEVATSFGAKDKPTLRLVKELNRHIKRYLSSTAPVGEHLADQLLLPMALLAGGRFRCTRPSEHTLTNASIINRFLGEGTVTLEQEGRDEWMVVVEGRSEGESASRRA